MSASGWPQSIAALGSDCRVARVEGCGQTLLAACETCCHCHRKACDLARQSLAGAVNWEIYDNDERLDFQSLVIDAAAKFDIDDCMKTASRIANLVATAFEKAESRKNQTAWRVRFTESALKFSKTASAIIKILQCGACLSPLKSEWLNNYTDLLAGKAAANAFEDDGAALVQSNMPDKDACDGESKPVRAPLGLQASVEHGANVWGKLWDEQFPVAPTDLIRSQSTTSTRRSCLLPWRPAWDTTTSSRGKYCGYQMTLSRCSSTSSVLVA